MKFCLPNTIDEALAQLAQPDARCLAGGQSLVAMMNANLLEPAALVSLRNIAALSEITLHDDGSFSIGAMATHAAVAKMKAPGGALELLRATAAGIGHPAIRAQGTIGGSICHADPAADYPTAITAAAAEIEIASSTGRRRVPAAAFFAGYYETAVQPGEMVVAVHIPASPAGARAHYEKFSLIDGDFAVISVAVIIGMHAGRCSYARLAVGACAPTPVRLAAAEAALAGSTLDDNAIAAASTLIAAECDPIDDARGSGSYRMKLVPRLIRRALLSAREKAEGRQTEAHRA